MICGGQGKGLFAVKIESRTGPSPNNSDITPEGDLRPHYDEVFTATPLWTNKPLGAQFATPVLKDGLLFGYNGSFFCADAKTAQHFGPTRPSGARASRCSMPVPVLPALTVKGELIAFSPAKRNTRNSRRQSGRHRDLGPPGRGGHRIFVKDVETLSLWTFGP